MTYGHDMDVAWVWPLILVRERFASGEITEQEYRERMRVLDEH